MPPRRTVGVSACLLGVRCRSDGRDRLDAALRATAGDAVLVPVCPEELGGLGTPRPAAGLRGGACAGSATRRAGRPRPRRRPPAP
ncbi:MAG: DUF523 domain-containing protein [Planctomycetes bacterium]|nr:DUF523 domain-containing protein [Planctomycetota bacterium]